MKTLALASLLFCLVLLGQPSRSQAGCGCDKLPPEPAAVIQNAAFPGMPVTFFYNKFKVGQTWTVVFHSASSTVSVQGSVVLKRTITDPTGSTKQPQLVIVVPDLPMGPTSLEVSMSKASFVVPKESFTVIGKPVMIAEQAGNYAVKNYTTGVGADGTLYISLGGLNQVCKPMEIRGLSTNYPLRFANWGDVVILNHQGFFIDSFDKPSADHFFIQPLSGGTSDRVDYFRHSFAQYCADHQPGGVKAIDPQDPNWHLDGTAHTDYSTLIFAISGRLSDGSIPKAGDASFALTLQASIGDNNEMWAHEKAEESVSGAGK